jgi:teichoic acid transport system ATP-binding protein
MLADAGTLLLVSHSVAEIKARCTRVIWLERGLLKMDGPTAEVLAAYDG